MTKRVLILCTGNSARSQMAEGLLRSFGGGRFEVFSAGTKPSVVRPEAIAVMSELGIDLSSHRSKHVGEFDGQHFDYVITVCDNANESCPIFPGDTERIHWSFPDPAAIEGTETERLDGFSTRSRCARREVSRVRQRRRPRDCDVEQEQRSSVGLQGVDLTSPLAGALRSPRTASSPRFDAPPSRGDPHGRRSTSPDRRPGLDPDRRSPVRRTRSSC